MKLKSSKDYLYAKQISPVSDFVFDENVANVFEDMIKRSIPGYDAILNMIGVLTEQYVTEYSHCYDLGCSLGAVTLMIRRSIKIPNVKIVAVDNSSAMTKKCSELINNEQSQTLVDVVCDDIQNIQIERASMVVSNFTLQFIQPEHRRDLIQKIYQGMIPGGILILSDKIAFEDKIEEEYQTQLHHNFKKRNGYSELEIAQKRTALEKVLVPDTLKMHQDRLLSCGFSKSYVWFKCFNFASLLAIK